MMSFQMRGFIRDEAGEEAEEECKAEAERNVGAEREPMHAALSHLDQVLRRSEDSPKRE